MTNYDVKLLTVIAKNGVTDIILLEFSFSKDFLWIYQALKLEKVFLSYL